LHKGIVRYLGIGILPLPSSSQTAYELLRDKAPKTTTRPSRCCGCAVTHAEEVNAELLSFFGEKASKATKAVA